MIKNTHNIKEYLNTGFSIRVLAIIELELLFLLTVVVLCAITMQQVFL
jgi:hypothetical protein